MLDTINVEINVDSIQVPLMAWWEIKSVVYTKLEVWKGFVHEN